jgi:hypothetical protein
MSKKKAVLDKWTEIEDSMLIDIPRGRKTPLPGKPWTYHLFAWDVEVRDLKAGPKEFAKRQMVTVEGRTRDEADERTVAIVEAARLVPEGARTPSGERTKKYAVLESETRHD